MRNIRHNFRESVQVVRDFSFALFPWLQLSFTLVKLSNALGQRINLLACILCTLLSSLGFFFVTICKLLGLIVFDEDIGAEMDQLPIVKLNAVVSVIAHGTARCMHTHR